MIISNLNPMSDGIAPVLGMCVVTSDKPFTEDAPVLDGVIIEIYDNDNYEVEFKDFMVSGKMNRDQLWYKSKQPMTLKETILGFVEASIMVDGLNFQDETIGEVKHRHVTTLQTIKEHVEEVLPDDAPKKPEFINGCDTQAIMALRYLASYTRPVNGDMAYNSEHLLKIARELEQSIGKMK